MLRNRQRCAAWALAMLLGLSREAAAEQFPADSGVLNVHDFGAVGDGKHDDTTALLAAIAAAGEDTGTFFWRSRIVYLPAGTYRVTRPLTRHYANGHYASGMLLIGESAARTVIRLSDHADGFDNRQAPRGVIMTTSKLLDGTPTSGGKDYIGKGEGNDAYENFVEDLTIDVGAGNPGAIGIDYLANNIGAIRNVRVIAEQDSGAAGIAMQRKWPGPALLQRVEVNGFDTGVAVANTEYGVTLDHVTLDGQRQVGLINDGNAVSAADLTIAAAHVAIVNSAPGGLVSLTHSVLRRASDDATPLQNRGVVVAHDVTLDGFAPPQGANNALSGFWQGDRWQAQQAQGDPQLVDAPSSDNDPPDRWVNVLSYAHGATTKDDITDALRRAMRTGASTIYLPFGRYTIDDGISIPPTVRRIVGMNSSITVRPERKPEFARDTGMFRIDQPGPPLRIERLAFDMTNLGDQLAVQMTADRDVTLRDVISAGTSLLHRTQQGGRVFLEDTCCGSISVAGPRPVYARQLDTEGGGTRIENNGSPLIILGLKTEGDCTVLDNRDHARSLILGGLVYIVGDANPAVPAFRNADSALQASFVEESFRAASRYTTYLRPNDAASFPVRGFGRVVPWLAAGH